MSTLVRHIQGETRVNQRDTFLDLVKFFAMFMVIYSHVISYREGFDFFKGSSFPLNFIMAVNMPIFFMVSGLFSKHMLELQSVGKLLNRYLTYFYPLAFWGGVFSILECTIYHKCTFSYIPVLAIRKFLFCGWFFYALAGVEGITFLAWKYGKTYGMRLLLFFVAYIVCLLGVGRIWHMSNIVAMFPFYLFGVLCLSHIFENRLMLAICAVIGGCVMLVITFFTGNVAINGIAFYWNHFDILHPEKWKLFCLIIRIFVGVTGGLFVFACVKLMDRIKVLSWLSRFGPYTLGVFFLQDELIKYVACRLVGLDASASTILFVAILVTFLSFLLVMWSYRSKILRNLFWGQWLKR